MTRLRIEADGAFSLAAAASFAQGFPGTRSGGCDETLAFAWALDGDWRTVEVEISQDDGGLVVEAQPELGDEVARLVRRDLEAILCIDVDGRDFERVGERDRVVADLQRRLAGFRPVLFYTPYEAAAWCIIGQRIRRSQAATVKQRLAAELGERGAFPAPDVLAAMPDDWPGLTQRKVGQLRALAEAAGAGALDRSRLRALEEQRAKGELRELAGIGPFSAELVLIRGVGAPDALPEFEPRVASAVRERYGLADDADIAPVAEAWRPYRSWVSSLLRAAA